MILGILEGMHSVHRILNKMLFFWKPLELPGSKSHILARPVALSPACCVMTFFVYFDCHVFLLSSESSSHTITSVHNITTSPSSGNSLPRSPSARCVQWPLVAFGNFLWEYGTIDSTGRVQRR